ncbi:hypothetical protein CR513_27489, partial [Mucuna pruriens]
MVSDITSSKSTIKSSKDVLTYVDHSGSFADTTSSQEPKPVKHIWVTCLLKVVVLIHINSLNCITTSEDDGMILIFWLSFPKFQGPRQLYTLIAEKKTWPADHPNIPRVLWQLQQLKLFVRYNILLPKRQNYLIPYQSKLVGLNLVRLKLPVGPTKPIPQLQPVDGILKLALQCSPCIQQLLLWHKIKLNCTGEKLEPQFQLLHISNLTQINQNNRKPQQPNSKPVALMKKLMPFILNIFKAQHCLRRSNHGFHLQKVTEAKFCGQHHNPEQRILNIVHKTFPQTTPHKAPALKPPRQHVEKPPICILNKIPNPRNYEKNHSQKLRNDEHKYNLQKVHHPIICRRRPPPILVPLRPYPGIKHTKHNNPHGGHNALQHHPHSKPHCLPRHQPILHPHIKQRLQKPQTTPSEENGQNPNLHSPILQSLPRVSSPLPSHNDSSLEKQYQHHPKPIKTPKQIPKRPLLHKPGLPHMLPPTTSSNKKVTPNIKRPLQLLKTPPTPKILINIVVVPPSAMRSSPIPTTINLALNSIINWLHHEVQKRVLTRNRGHHRLPRILVDEILQNSVQLVRHVVEDVADALRNEAQVRGLTPDQEVQRHVEKLAAEVGVAAASAVVGDPDVRLLPEVRTPRGIVFQQLLAKAAEHAAVKSIDVVRRRREAHLSVREVEDKVLALVANVVALEAEEERQPVEEVHVLPPLPERRSPEVANGAQRRHRRAHLGKAE